MTEFEALLLSAAIEGPLVFALVSVMRWPCRGPLHAALAIMLATAVTHPQLWAASLWLYPRIGYWSALAIGETAVVVAEAAIIAWAVGLSPTRAFVASVIANGASAAVGILLLA
jgi:hypothetical protein